MKVLKKKFIPSDQISIFDVYGYLLMIYGAIYGMVPNTF
jgi:hypothetical protein